jgi:hypothetical protein
MKQTIDVKTAALNRAVQLLVSLGAQYKIITADGAEYGELVAAAPKNGARYGYGVLRDHCRSFMETMNIGDVANVPWDGFDVDSVQASVGGYAYDKWGAGSVMSTRGTGNSTIEVMRVY